VSSAEPEIVAAALTIGFTAATLPRKRVLWGCLGSPRTAVGDPGVLPSG
jgi:hypothetical protein